MWRKKFHCETSFNLIHPQKMYRHSKDQPNDRTRLRLTATVIISLLLWSAILVMATVGLTFHLLVSSSSEFLRARDRSTDQPDQPVTRIISTTEPSTTTTAKCEAECLTPSAIKEKFGITQYNQQTCCTYHTELKHMLLELDEFFRMQSLYYFISSGTLIGSLRDGSIIPWDEDADLYLPVTPNEIAMTSIHLSETYIKLLSWNEVMPASKYNLRPGAIKKGKLITSFKLHRKDTIFLDRLTIKGPKVDLQLVHLDPQSSLHISNPYWFQKYSIPKAIIFPLTSCRLYGRSFPCPRDSKHYISLLYGEGTLENYESVHDFWAVKGAGDGPQKFSAQEKKKLKRVRMPGK